jgi:hypothetical protein
MGQGDAIRHPESLTENEAESFQGVAGRSIERKSQITSAQAPVSGRFKILKNLIPPENRSGTL